MPQLNQNRQITTDRIPTIALTPKKRIVIFHTLQTAIVVEVTVIQELIALKQYLKR